MDKEFVYIVTVMRKFDRKMDYEDNVIKISIGEKRIPVLCSSLEEALEVIENNICDIYEQYYEFACIEKIELNALYPCVAQMILFKYDKKSRKYFQSYEINSPRYTVSGIG